MKKQPVKYKIFPLILAILFCMATTGCGFRVGNVSGGGSDGYEDVFPDRVAELGKSYKGSTLAYSFKLGDYGSMNVYVDTSEGHSFELDAENGGFAIQDKSGKEVLHAYGLDPEMYKAITAQLSEVRTINNRDFFFSVDSDVFHTYSYFADCGLDCGMIFETEEGEDVFRLIAFRGTPIEGASSDLFAYQGVVSEVNETNDSQNTEETGNTEETDIFQEAENQDTDSSGDTPGALVNSQLGADVEEQLLQLQSDYNKVNWGVRYALSEDYPALVVSVAPYVSYGEYHLLVAFTNLYGEDVSVSGSAKAYGEGDEFIGETYIYTTAIGCGNTVLEDINCGEKIPDGRIHWEDCAIDTEPYDSFVAWQADYKTSGSTSDGYITIDYSIYADNGSEFSPGTVTFLILDDKGNIMGNGSDYYTDMVAAGEKHEGSASVFGEEEFLSQGSSVAMFATSTH